ncbi:unnamed protein product [Ceutorhynchus assimilis]|uniref:DUF4485 domain-containing protein n=1 Tax=Ceutorhynchus assimilis TaxID=467358 RepID=A0A9N9MHW1_9CUCU|nr:unnamed protein product [Ceutorhynchus assimilis]
MQDNEARLKDLEDAKIALINENFLFNYELVMQLQEFLVPREKELIRIWCEKLFNHDENLNQINLRKHYMTYIFLMLQKGGISEPFTRLPPSELPILSQIVPREIYLEVVAGNEHLELQ